MENDETSRSFRITMIEIIIIIGIFSIISVFILQMFMAADSLQKKAVNTSKALIQVESVAEVLKGSDSFETALLGLGMSEETDENQMYYVMYFNDEWKQVQEAKAHAIQVVISTKTAEAGKMEIAAITALDVKDNKDETDIVKSWCNITVEKYCKN